MRTVPMLAASGVASLRDAGAEAVAARSPAARGGATAAPPGRRPRRFATRRRLLAAFFILGVAFVAAFAFQLQHLAGMKRALGERGENEERMRLALELEAAIREQFAHQTGLLLGEEWHLAGYRDAQARAAGLAASLAGSVEEPELASWVAEILVAMRELDRAFRERGAQAAGAPAAVRVRVHADAYPFVFHAEQTADRIFASLRNRTVAQSGAVEAMHRATERLALLFTVAVPLLAVGLAVYLSRSIAKPLADIGEGAGRFAKGDLSSRIDVAGADEFGTLASELNAMAATLERDRDELVRSEKLAGLGRVAAGIAHELNDPLQVMIGYLGLHRDVDGEIGVHLRRAEREATRCREIVEALLQLARPAEFVPVPVDLRQVADAVAASLRPSAPAGLGIRVEGEATALGTEGRIRQVVFNLVRNAAEAAGAGDAVNVGVGRDGPFALLSVSDTGPGVPPEVRRRIFEPFFTTKPTGTGLGLAIGRAIANALGGDLVLEEGEGRGATFTLRVPGAELGGRA